MRFTVSGKSVTVTAKDAIGKGGEADVYDIHGGKALKVFKAPDDPDYANDSNAQEGARRRLIQQQDKLPAFPKNLPAEVVVPRELARDGSGKIVGYTMDYRQNCEVLLRYSDRRFREQGGVSPGDVVKIFNDLALTVGRVHDKGVVIGDFNDLNVLVKGTVATLIDADSFQFGKFMCKTFTPRFLDPLCSEVDRLEMHYPLSVDSDWYAFSVMLFQCLLYVDPYGGVHRPKVGKRLQHDARVLKRITVFNPEVIYPKPAIPYDYLPDEILDYFHAVFEGDSRGGWSLIPLDSVEWTKCSNCGTEHARPSCPACQVYVKKEPVVVRGNVRATRAFLTEGTIVCAVHQGGKLRYVYHNGQEFVRENGSLVDHLPLAPDFRYRIRGDVVYIGRRDKLVAFSSHITTTDVDAYGHLPVFDANSTDLFWAGQDGILARYDALSPRRIGTILTGRTLFWVGEKFGFGFYRAGSLMRAFVFSTTTLNMNDQVSLPDFNGELVDTTCAFADDRVWFFATMQEKGRLLNRVYVIDGSGRLVASRVVPQTEDDWLATGIRGRFAAGHLLYVPTDEGIVRVDEALTVEKRFPDTEPFVNSTSYLLSGDGGIYVVKPHEITLVTIS